MTTSDKQAPPPPPLTASEPFVSAHTRAMVVVALFAAYILVAVSSIAAVILQLALPPVVLAAAEDDLEQVTLNDLIMFLVAVATLFVFISLVIAFCVWLHRAAKNLPALGNEKSKIEYSPGWAVGSFFVPFVNLVVPYKAVKEVWEKSDPVVRGVEDSLFTTPSSSPPLILGWWIAWLVSNFLSNIAWRLESKSTSDTTSFVASVDVISNLAGIVAAVLAVMVVRDIDRRQTERAQHVSYDANLPPPPPDFRTQPNARQDAEAEQTPSPFRQS